MNSKALLSSVLVLAFAFFSLSFINSASNSQEKLSSSVQAALELEKSNFERAILEQNTDFLIEKIIEKQALKKQVSSFEITAALNSSLSAYFHAMQEKKGFLFFEKEFPNSSYSKLSQNNALPFVVFTDEFKVNVVRLEEHLFFVNVSYVGGASGKKLFFGIVQPSLGQKQFFVIPLGYSVKKLVVS